MGEPVQPDIDAQISTLDRWGLPETFDFKALIACALKNLALNHLSQVERTKNSDADSSTTPFASTVFCTSISELGWGTYNRVYRLSLSSGVQVAAVISKADEETFCIATRQSEIATMEFVRESGLYPHVPVPRVHAWSAGFDETVGAAWMLMDVVEGVMVDEDMSGQPIGTGQLDMLPQERQLAIVKSLARLQVYLSTPLPFDKIGSIFFKQPTRPSAHVSKHRDTFAVSDYKIGPSTHFSQRTSNNGHSGPYSSITEMYRARLERQMSEAIELWSTSPTDALESPESCLIDLTPQTFSRTYNMLSALIPKFEIPPSKSALVLHHPDIALRNVFFDKASLETGNPRITGVIDWAGSQVLPLMLASKYPSDLMSNKCTPFQAPNQHSDGGSDGPRLEPYWTTVPWDWTSIGRPEDWPRGFDGKPMDHTPSLSAQVRRYYLRTYFGACYASQMHEIHGDMSLRRVGVFEEASYYLKFHEVMRACVSSDHLLWVEETYWRLRALESSEVGVDVKGSQGSRTEGKGDEPRLITGPNAYRKIAPRPLNDLRQFNEEAGKWLRGLGVGQDEEEDGNGDEEDNEDHHEEDEEHGEESEEEGQRRDQDEEANESQPSVDIASATQV